MTIDSVEQNVLGKFTNQNQVSINIVGIRYRTSTSYRGQTQGGFWSKNLTKSEEGCQTTGSMETKYGTHICRLICEWTYAKTNWHMKHQREHFGGVSRVSYISKTGKYHNLQGTF